MVDRLTVMEILRVAAEVREALAELRALETGDQMILEQEAALLMLLAEREHRAITQTPLINPRIQVMAETVAVEETVLVDGEDLE